MVSMSSEVVATIGYRANLQAEDAQKIDKTRGNRGNIQHYTKLRCEFSFPGFFRYLTLRKQFPQPGALSWLGPVSSRQVDH